MDATRQAAIAYLTTSQGYGVSREGFLAVAPPDALTYLDALIARFPRALAKLAPSKRGFFARIFG